MLSQHRDRERALQAQRMGGSQQYSAGSLGIAGGATGGVYGYQQNYGAATQLSGQSPISGFVSPGARGSNRGAQSGFGARGGATFGGFGSQGARGSNRGAQSGLVARGGASHMGRGGDRGRGGVRGRGGDRGRGMDRGRGRGFGGERGRGAGQSFRGAMGRGGAERGRGANRGHPWGAAMNMLEQGIPDSWADLARANKGGQRGRGHGGIGFFTSHGTVTPRGDGKKSRGPEYTAENALEDSPWACQVCNMKVTGPSNLTDHFLGTKHKSVVNTFLNSGKPIPEEMLICKLCQVSTPNHDHLLSHLGGQKHQLSLLHYGGKQGASVKSPSEVKPSVLSDLALVKEPMIGLDLITEFLHVDPPQDPHYECKPCDLVLIGGNLKPHVLGHKHRYSYIQNYRVDYWRQYLKPIVDTFAGEVNDGSKTKWEGEKDKQTALSKMVKDVATRIEAVEGRRTVKSVTLRGHVRPTQAKPGIRTLTDLGSIRPVAQQVRNVNGTPPVKRLEPRELSNAVIKMEYERRFGAPKRPASEAAGGPPEKKPNIGQKPTLQSLLCDLSTTTIASEEDASMALQVSNNLTQALLNYRLNAINSK